MVTSVWIWVGFLLFVCAMLALDLGVFQRRAHAVSPKEAGIWTAVWVSLALLFSVVIYFWHGPTAALEYTSGYLIEKALSVDNLFVFVLIFTFFGVPAAYQHRVLFWGVLGALVLRGLFVAVGAVLLAQFHWVVYVFGAFLLYTGIKLALMKEAEVHPDRNPLVRLFRKVIPVTSHYVGEHFFTRINGRRIATPLLLVLIVVESTDLAFATDSIPAVFAVTTDPFLVYTSNVFAILGLRSLYFLLAHAMEHFYYLKPALAVILSFVGVKMLISRLFEIPTVTSLAVIVGLLAVATIASLIRARRQSALLLEVVDQA
jgi:tellurite resistance protein TerC